MKHTPNKETIEAMTEARKTAGKMAHNELGTLRKALERREGKRPRARPGHLMDGDRQLACTVQQPESRAAVIDALYIMTADDARTLAKWLKQAAAWMEEETK